MPRWLACILSAACLLATPAHAAITGPQSETMQAEIFVVAVGISGGQLVAAQGASFLGRGG